MKQTYKPSDNQNIRSCIQKAVRRGDHMLVEKCFDYLFTQGDQDWLKRRLPVIAFEECWGHTPNLYIGKDSELIKDEYKTISQLVKNKDAAGLGSLAYELSQGDRSVLKGESTDSVIINVANGLTNPKEFWKFPNLPAMLTEEQNIILKKSYYGFKQASWTWDKAFAISTAVLSLNSQLPLINNVIIHENKLPIWVAFDKHTTVGKNILSSVARSKGLDVELVYWMSFYFESAMLNEYQESYWWQREMNWRLMKFGLDISQAEDIWNKIRPDVSNFLKEEGEKLENDLTWNLGKVTNDVLLEALDSSQYHSSSSS
jgi:hypothetical protein